MSSGALTGRVGIATGATLVAGRAFVLGISVVIAIVVLAALLMVAVSKVCKRVFDALMRLAWGLIVRLIILVVVAVIFPGRRP